MDRRNPTRTVIADRCRLTVDGLERFYLLHRPSHLDPGTLPTIVDLHGSGESPLSHIATVDTAWTAAVGAVVLTPTAAHPFVLIPGCPPGAAWSIPGVPLPGETHTDADRPDDINFLEQLIDAACARHGLDPGRVHLRGYSGGARLASLFAVTTARRLASLCAVSGVRGPTTAMHAEYPPPVLAIHGKSDTVNPYAGGIPGRWEDSVEDSVLSWAQVFGVTTYTRYRLSADAEELRYTQDGSFSPVRLIRIAHGGHAWPGSADDEHHRRFGPSSRFSATEAHLAFVREMDARSWS